MSAFTYDRHGRRVRFDPATVRACLTGCLLCGTSPVAMIGAFIPDTDEMRAAVRRLRTHPLRPGGTLATSYGLCEPHAISPDCDLIEDAILKAAQRVGLQ